MKANRLELADPEEVSSRILAWHDDPAQFVYDNFGMTKDDDGQRIPDDKFIIDPWQLDVLNLLPRKECALSKSKGWETKVRIAMKACAGPGKSTVLAWVGWWFLTVFGEEGKHPKCSSLSVTWDNLKFNLWAEFSKWQHRSPFLLGMFTQTAEKIACNDHVETWILAAKSYRKDADAETQGITLSGQHSEFILYLIDEAGDINPAILKAAEQGMSNCEVGLIICAGNTTSNTGMLYEVSTRLRDRWHVVSITADPEDPKRTSRVDKVWAAEMIQTYGRDNWWVMAYILGQFPPGSISALIDVDSVEKAIERHVLYDDYALIAKRIGGDIARFGDDMTVLFPRQGKVAFAPVVMRNARSNEISERWFAGHNRFGSEQDFVDATGGWGAGVVDHSRLLGHAIIEVNFSGKPLDARFFNKRAEILWNTCEWIRQGGSLPNVPGLVRELTAVNYYFDKGKLRVEEKEQIKKRTGKSPDHFDALATTFAIPDQPATFYNRPYENRHQAMAGYEPFNNSNNGQHKVEYDPYEASRF